MINELVEKITVANQKYRLGNPIMSDLQYDILVNELRSLDPNNQLLNIVGHEIQDESRKGRLPIEMGSMNKIKSMEDINDWCRLKGISKSENVIITPKFDGLSLCVKEPTNEAWTRGDGEFGQKSNEHYKLIKNHLGYTEDVDTFSQDLRMSTTHCDFTYGEVMMSKKTFLDKYSMDFANPRNFVAGLLNSPDARPSLTDCNYIKYGAIFNPKFINNSDLNRTKQQVLDYLNSHQNVKVEYHICKISELTEELLISLFHKFGTEYEIDGLIIEINDLSLQTKLGRETSSNNPVWARAFKHPSFEQSADSEVIGISWNISKQGLLKPILHIKPVRLDGVTVSNVTGNNARFVKDMGLGIGAKVLVKRSGMVIPIIADVITTVEFQMPDVPNIGWNDNGIELITLTETDEQRFKQVVSFFEILDTDSFGEGVIKQLWDNGHKTIKDILNLSQSDLEKIDRFGKRKAQIVWNAIRKSTNDVSLSKLQHATGIFKGLGSKKLILLEHFTSKPSIDQILEIEGFAEISAQSYIDGYDKFFEFIQELPITIQEKIEAVKVSNDLDGMIFVFTGVRRANLEDIIESRGGKIGSGVSKTTTHLIMKSVGSGSSKEKKAIDFGVKIMTVEQLENLLK
jgi:NAD-dependent DNA ligase